MRQTLITHRAHTSGLCDTPSTRGTRAGAGLRIGLRKAAGHHTSCIDMLIGGNSVGWSGQPAGAHLLRVVMRMRDHFRDSAISLRLVGQRFLPHRALRVRSERLCMTLPCKRCSRCVSIW